MAARSRTRIFRTFVMITYSKCKMSKKRRTVKMSIESITLETNFFKKLTMGTMMIMAPLKKTS